MIQRSLLIINKLGLHTRAASKLASLASRYEAEVTLIRDNKRASGKSILDIMTLGASQGTELSLVVTGPDEEEACQAVTKLVVERFGEGE